jgi:hypothetical protein
VSLESKRYGYKAGSAVSERANHNSLFSICLASSLDSKSSAARRLNFLIAVAAPALHSPKKTRRAM